MANDSLASTAAERKRQLGDIVDKVAGDKAAWAKKIKPALPVAAKAAAWVEVVAVPAGIKAANKAEQLWAAAQPFVEKHDLRLLVPAVSGLALCFFGGCFPLVIAAVEAFRLAGWNSGMKPACLELLGEANKSIDVVKKSGRDSQYALLAGKVVGTVDPDVVSRAVASLGAGLMAVLAALKLQFARALALGAALGEAVRDPIHDRVVPRATAGLSAEHAKWVPIGLDWALKLITITLAFMLQRFSAAVYSAFRGGVIATRCALEYMRKRGITKVKDEDTNIDEFIGYGLSAVGVIWQVSSGFSLGFPLGLLLLPVSMAEWMLTVFVAWAP